MSRLSGVERWWFRIQFAGENVPMFYYSDDDPNQDFDSLDGDVDETFAVWRAECERSRQITAAAAEPRLIRRPAVWCPAWPATSSVAPHVADTDELAELAWVTLAEIPPVCPPSHVRAGPVTRGLRAQLISSAGRRTKQSTLLARCGGRTLVVWLPTTAPRSSRPYSERSASWKR
jgi:hypothetical protein